MDKQTDLHSDRRRWTPYSHKRIRNFRSNRICGYDSNLESNQGVVVYMFSDERRCVASPGSSNNIARSFLQCQRVFMLLLRKHKINLNYKGATVEVFCSTVSVVCGTTADAADLARHFWIESHWNRPIESNLKASLNVSNTSILTETLRRGSVATWLTFCEYNISGSTKDEDF